MAEIVEKKLLKDVADWMKPNKETNLPNTLKGVFFLDGNPLPDTCITMYNLEWNAQKLSLSLPVYKPLQWTFHNSIFGWLLLLVVQITQLTYKIKFQDETLRSAHIIPVVFGLSVPQWVIDLSMSQIENFSNGDTWKRTNIWLGGLSRAGEYTMRRVVNADGSYTPAFQDMLNKAPIECLVVTANS